MEREGQNHSGLLLLSALLSIQMAQELSDDDLALLAAFFTVLGDNLALLALRQDGPPPAVNRKY